MKIHTIGHAVHSRSADARLVFETAAELEIPVMVHTGAGVPFAEPAMWIPLALEFPETTVILAHAGGGIYTGPAIVAAEICPNIVLETSSCNPTDILRMADAVGSERVLFGSDLLPNAGAELAKYEMLGLPA
ncbi:MAG: amidohydrolase family protein, partial [Proteobacteria bacterium]|nr:amidohydrolase family protein [Pseudomonadota bacterium]